MTIQESRTAYMEKLDNYVQLVKRVWDTVRSMKELRDVLTKTAIAEIDYDIAFFDDSCYVFDEFEIMRRCYFPCTGEKHPTSTETLVAMDLHSTRNKHSVSHWCGSHIPRMYSIEALCDITATAYEQECMPKDILDRIISAYPVNTKSMRELYAYNHIFHNVFRVMFDEDEESVNIDTKG